MGAGEGGKLRRVQHQPPPRRGGGADGLRGALAGVLEHVAEAQHRPFHDGERARRRRLLRGGERREGGEEGEGEGAHGRGTPQRICARVDSISSIALMALLFIS